MKHLLLFLLCQGSLDSFCQVADIIPARIFSETEKWYTSKEYLWEAYINDSMYRPLHGIVRHDTLEVIPPKFFDSLFTTAKYVVAGGKTFIRCNLTCYADTLRATLLMTRGSMQASYAYEGYVIMKDSEVVK